MNQVFKISLLIPMMFAFVACATTPETPPPEAKAPTKKEAKVDALAMVQGPAVTSANVSNEAEKKESSATEAPAKTEAPVAASAPSETHAAAPAAAETKAEATHSTASEKKDAAKAPAEHHSSHREVGKVSWEKSFGWLKNGNSRFRKGFLRKDGQSASEREALTAGQHPHAIVLSCSDSRVPPEIVFDQKLGEIFVVRTAGQSLDSSAIASIEYAVSHLGPNLIVVMGHESCGAVKAAYGTLSGGDAGSAWLNKLVADIHPRIMSFKGKELSKGALVEGWANIHGVAKDLIERSDIVREAVESGTLKITKSLYHLGSGEVEWKD